MVFVGSVTEFLSLSIQRRKTESTHDLWSLFAAVTGRQNGRKICDVVVGQRDNMMMMNPPATSSMLIFAPPLSTRGVEWLNVARRARGNTQHAVAVGLFFCCDRRRARQRGIELCVAVAQRESGVGAADDHESNPCTNTDTILVCMNMRQIAHQRTH